MRSVRLAATFLLCAVFLAAQTNRGAISGTVMDPSGAVIPGATVTVTSVGTDQTRRVTTSNLGTFTVQDLEPVAYKVTVEAQGFKKEVIEGVKVDTASIASVNVSLQTGTVETQITVSADAVMVNTESGNSSNTITERQIQDVPLLNRSVLDLALTLPNVSGDAGSEDPVLTSVTPCPGCNLTIGGGRPMSSMMMADGTNNTGVSLARTMVSFTPETVQEFTRPDLGLLGRVRQHRRRHDQRHHQDLAPTNLHGTALWYNRNPDFAAAPFTLATTNRSAPTLKYNQFSLAAGGPVYIPKVYNGKNKTFWFAAIEPYYRRDHLDQYGLMPTAGMRKGDFSGMVNTTSGWLPQSVVQQFSRLAPAAVAPLGDSAIYNQFNVVGGNQFTQAAIPTGQTGYQPFPGNVIPVVHAGHGSAKGQPYIASAGPYFLDSNGN